MAPPRVDKKKFSKEKSKKKTDKTDSKSSLPSTTIAVAITAFIAISVAVYYKNGFNMEGKLDQAQRTSIRNTARTSNNKKTEINADFEILPRLDGVKVGDYPRNILNWLHIFSYMTSLFITCSYCYDCVSAELPLLTCPY